MARNAISVLLDWMFSSFLWSSYICDKWYDEIGGNKKMCKLQENKIYIYIFILCWQCLDREALRLTSTMHISFIINIYSNIDSGVVCDRFSDLRLVATEKLWIYT